MRGMNEDDLDLPTESDDSALQGGVASRPNGSIKGCSVSHGGSTGNRSGSRGGGALGVGKLRRLRRRPRRSRRG